MSQSSQTHTIIEDIDMIDIPGRRLGYEVTDPKILLLQYRIAKIVAIMVNKLQ